jgi:signal transduction histidine kinase
LKIASLKLRLLLGAAAFIFTALAIAAVGLTTLFERHVKSWIDVELNANLDQLISGLDASEQGVVVKRAPSDPRFDAPLSGLYWEAELHPSGKVIRSRSLWDFKIKLPEQTAIDDAIRRHRVAGPDQQQLYLLQRHVALPKRLGEASGRFAVAINEAEVQAAVWRFARALTPFLVLLGALLSAAAWMQVHFGLRPLATIRERISGVRTGAMKRIGAGLPDEVQPLASEIDTLLDQRDAQIETARARAADLAHGLKTPIQILIGGVAALKSNGEMAIADDIEAASLTMHRQVERQLARARATAGADDVRSDARRVAAEVVRVMQKTPHGGRVSWSVEIAEGVSVRIHADDLAEAIGAIADNAGRHARSSVQLDASESDGFVTITVTDDGDGIAEANFDEAMGRGQRLDMTGPGSGLGLAIVSDVASAWGGGVSFLSSAAGFSVNLRLRAG